MNGKVKFFNEMKGFGFVVSDDGKEYFVHISGLQEGVSLNENDDVTFDVEEGDRGPKAVNVAKADGSSAPAEEAPEEEAPAEEEPEAEEEPAEEDDSEEEKEE